MMHLKIACQKEEEKRILSILKEKKGKLLNKKNTRLNSLAVINTLSLIPKRDTKLLFVPLFNC